MKQNPDVRHYKRVVIADFVAGMGFGLLIAGILGAIKVGIGKLETAEAVIGALLIVSAFRLVSRISWKKLQKKMMKARKRQVEQWQKKSHM